MADAVRLALEHNHQLRAQRLNVDISKADEITAALKPNPVLTSTNENFPVFSPSQLFSWDNFVNNQNFVESLSYLFERGGKREKRTLVAQDTTERRGAGPRPTPSGSWRFRREQAFINVLLAKSTLDLAQRGPQELLERRRRQPRAAARRRSRRERLLQDLAAEAAVRAGRLGGRGRAGAGEGGAAAERRLRERSPTTSTSTATSTYTKYAVTLDDLKRDALAARPDLLAAQGGVKLAQDTQALAYRQPRARRHRRGRVRPRRRRSTRSASASRSSCRFHDRNQGNIAHSKVAITQATETEAQARDSTVLTDVVNAYAAFQTSEKVARALSSPAISIRRSSRSTSRPTSTSTAAARCSICSTPSAPTGRRSWRSARRWRRT